jgi:two-component system, OmpR family, sensor histidine kinase MtrB
VASGITTLRESRRRASLNEAMHELRRPLQALALALPEEGEACLSSLQVATVALERLDREINGRPAEGAVRPLAMRPVLEAAVGRWKPAAALHGRGLRLSWAALDPCVIGDEIKLAQSLDNLISNAIEHGAGEVRVEARESGGRLLLLVVDTGGRDSRPPLPPGSALRGRINGRHRHGHGLRVVARTARALGGSFRLRCFAGRTEARIELPLLERLGR